MEFLERDTDARVLDVGCDDGRFTIRCAERIATKDVYGIEIDEKRAREASKRGIRTTVWDANHRLPFDDDYFDVVISNQVLEHLHNTDMFLEELHRILKEDGYSVISTPNLASLHNVLLLLVGKQPTSVSVSEIQVGNPLRGVAADIHISLFTLPGLLDLLQHHEFKAERISGCGFYPFRGFMACFLSDILPRYSVYLTVKIRPLGK